MVVMIQIRQVFGAAARMAFAALSVCLVSGLISGPAAATSARWWVLESQSGQVQLVKMGISPIALTKGDVFAIGDWIETGPDGRAVLRRGEETIVVAPNSRIGLPTENTGPFATRILQTLGTILLTVEKKAQQHFEVQTPYLTAVVKGTTFTVGIQDGHSVVHVVEGLVEVKNLASGHSTLVRPGQTGAVTRGGARDVDVKGGGSGAEVDVAASETPARDKKTAPAATATPAPAPAVTANAVRNAGAIKIEQALGPKTLDLSQSTDGLVRATGRGAPPAALGSGAAKPAPAAMGRGAVAAATSELTSAKASALALENGAGSGLGRAALSDAGGTGLALGRGTAAATAASSLGNASSTGLAAGQVLKSNPVASSVRGNAAASSAATATAKVK